MTGSLPENRRRYQVMVLVGLRDLYLLQLALEEFKLRQNREPLASFALDGVDDLLRRLRDEYDVLVNLMGAPPTDSS